MKKINYVYYIFLFIILCVIFKYSDYIEDIIGIDGYLCLEIVHALWLLCFQNVVYLIVRKKGVKDDFCITHQCKFDWSTFWVDTIHNELACLCMFNPFKIQYVSMNRVHDAEIKIKYYKHDECITGLSICFYIDDKKQKFRINANAKYGWENTKENVEILTKDARKLMEAIKNKPIQM